MEKFIAYGGRLHMVLDEDDVSYLIDARWHPSDKPDPCVVEKARVIGKYADGTPITLGFSVADYVCNCGINWATDECATLELAQSYYEKRVKEGRRMGSDAPRWDSIRCIWCVHFHW